MRGEPAVGGVIQASGPIVADRPGCRDRRLEERSHRGAVFASDRLVPKAAYDRGKDRLGSIHQAGQSILALVAGRGAMAVIRSAKMHGTKTGRGSPG